jgi:hypothetical protein
MDMIMVTKILCILKTAHHSAKGKFVIVIDKQVIISTTRPL